MTFDEAGDLFVAERQPCLSTVEVWDAIPLPEGGEVRVLRRRRSSTDRIKRFKDVDRDGVFEKVEVVAEGFDQLTGLIRHGDHLLVTASGRLERWSDHDLDGHWETRSVLIDGMGAASSRGLSAVRLGRDGWLYLSSGDDESHPIGRDGSRQDLSHMGSIFRCRIDGTQLQIYCQGLRDPGDTLTFDRVDTPIIFDAGSDDGSRYGQGRLIEVSEKGDYGWRSSSSLASVVDIDRTAWNGERPGKLAGFASIARGKPSSLLVCNSSAMPEVCQGLIVAADPDRKMIRGFKVESAEATKTLVGETTLMASLDPRFCPIRVQAGLDGSWYVLDRRAFASSESSTPVSNGQGRIYRITWNGDAATATPLASEKGANRTTSEPLPSSELMSSNHARADRSCRELIARGEPARAALLGVVGNRSNGTYARLLAFQAVRQFWSDEVESTATNLLIDGDPVLRRLAAQALSWEPKRPIARITPRLVDRLDDPDPRVAREAASALGRHAVASPRVPAAQMVRWLLAHPTTDPATKDRLIRSLEQLGDVGIGEIDLAVRTRRGQEREAAVDDFVSLRSNLAAENLPGLARLPDLTAGERVKLFRQFRVFPLDVAPTTSVLVDWTLKHLDSDPTIKLAALEECRVAGNPASSLILSLLEDDDPDVRVAATRLATISRPPGAAKLLEDRALDPDRSSEERKAVVDALGKTGFDAYSSIEKVALEADDHGLKVVALNSLASIDRRRATATLIAATNQRDPSIRREAVAILGQQKLSSIDLSKAFLEQSTTMQDPRAILEILRRWPGDREMETLAAKVVAEAGRRKLGPEPIEAASSLSQKGNPWRGLDLFYRPNSQCASCHQVGGKGGKIGPPLDLDAHRLDKAQLIEAIFQPSKSYKAGFEPARLAYASERAEPGQPAEATPLQGVNRALIEGGGGEMPSHVAWNFTTGEMADLVSFLLDRSAQEAVGREQGRADRIAVIGPLPMVPDRSGLPLDRIELSAASKNPFGESVHWESLAPAPTGEFDLGGFLGSFPGRADIAAVVQSPRPQDAWLRLTTHHAARIYLNGVKVGETTQGVAESSTSQDARAGTGATPFMVSLSLKEGKNLIFVALDGTSEGSDRFAIGIIGPDGFTLTVPKDAPDR